MLADWSKLDREVACKQIGSVQKGGGPARSLCFSLSLSVLMSVPHPCLFCVCVQACKQEAEKERRTWETNRDSVRLVLARVYWRFYALFCWEELNWSHKQPPPFSPHQQKCIHLDTNTHMRSQTGSFTERCLVPLFHSQWIQLLFSKETGAFGCSLSFFGPSGGVLRPRHS